MLLTRIHCCLTVPSAAMKNELLVEFLGLILKFSLKTMFEFAQKCMEVRFSLKIFIFFKNITMFPLIFKNQVPF